MRRSGYKRSSNLHTLASLRVQASVVLRNVRVLFAGAHWILAAAVVGALTWMRGRPVSTAEARTDAWMYLVASSVACAGAMLLGRRRSAWLVPLAINGLLLFPLALAVVGLLHVLIGSGGGSYGGWLASMSAMFGLLALAPPILLSATVVGLLLSPKVRAGIESEGVVRDGTARVLSIWAFALPLAPWAAMGGRLDAHPGSRVEAIAYSSRGKSLATAGNDGCVRLWDAESGAWRHSLPECPEKETAYGPRASIAFSGDGSRIVRTAGTGDLPGDVRVFRVSDGVEVRRLAPYLAGVRGAALSPDGTRAVITSTNGVVVVPVDRNDPPEEITTTFHHAIAWSADGTFIVALSRSDVMVWRQTAGTFALDVAIPRDDAAGEQVSFAGASNTIILCGSQMIERLDPQLRRVTGRVVVAGMPSGCAPLPDGRRVGVPSRNYAAAWHFVDFDSEATFDLPTAGGQSVAAVSPDGKELTVGSDGRVETLSFPVGKHLRWLHASR